MPPDDRRQPERDRDRDETQQDRQPRRDQRAEDHDQDDERGGHADDFRFGEIMADDVVERRVGADLARAEHANAVAAVPRDRRDVFILGAGVPGWGLVQRDRHDHGVAVAGDQALPISRAEVVGVHDRRDDAGHPAQIGGGLLDHGFEFRIGRGVLGRLDHHRFIRAGVRPFKRASIRSDALIDSGFCV